MINGIKNNKQQLDKATALLSLVKARESACSPCLTTQEMAELIDTKCEAVSLSTFHKHLSSCDNCYQEWLFLKNVQEKTQKKNTIYKLSNNKKLGVAGTAFAAAASIAVFLNISQHDDIIQKQLAPKREMSSQVDSPPPSPLPLEVKRKKTERLSSSFSNYVLEEQQDMEKEETEQHYSADSMEGMPPTPSQPTMRTSKQAIIIGNVANPAKPDKQQAELDSWLDELLEKCEVGSHSPSFWSSFRSKGEEILKGQTAGFSDEQKVRLQSLLVLLSQIDDAESATTQCQVIRSELAEDEKSK